MERALDRSIFGHGAGVGSRSMIRHLTPRRPRSIESVKRWIVERTFAWIARNRRLDRDFERYASTVVAFIRLAMIRIMLRRLTKITPYP